MSWTVIKEKENGTSIKKLPEEFKLSNIDFLYTGKFKILRYIDPYGDTTFNSLMLDDLIFELNELKVILSSDKEQIDRVIEIALECKSELHTYLKFYGD